MPNGGCKRRRIGRFITYCAAFAHETHDNYITISLILGEKKWLILCHGTIFFNGEYPIFAHRMENGKKENENIQEHILLCEKYFCRIEKEKELPEIIHRFLMRHLPEGTAIEKKT